MKTHGMPETFYIVTKPSPVSTLEDIFFACTYERLMQQARGGLQEDEIVGIFADETEARQAAARLLGMYPVCPQDAVFVEVVVNIQVQPKHEEMTARDLAKAAVEASCRLPPSSLTTRPARMRKGSVTAARVLAGKPSTEAKTFSRFVPSARDFK